MPVTRAAKKKLRQDKKRHHFNLIVKNKVKEIIKNFKAKPTEKLLASSFRILDIAKKKKIFKVNRVNRLKSRLASKVSPKKTTSPKS